MTHPDFRSLCAELAERLDLRTMKSRREIEMIDRARAALSAPQQRAQGLHGKYIIHRSADGSAVEFPCFVLRVDGADDAAMSAIQAYARHPDCPPELAADLVKQVQRNASFAVLGAAPQQGAPNGRELQWPASVAQGCHEAAVEAEMGSPLQQLLVAAGDLLESYGAQAVPVAERLPGPNDLSLASCWWYEPPGHWRFVPIGSKEVAQSFGLTHWRPWWAFPLPEAQP